MQAAVAVAKKQFGEINGVIHAAAITGDNLFRTIQELNHIEVSNQMRPKALGLYTLRDVLADEPLDFCLLTSSLSVVLGGVGLGTYSSANHFMDAFVHQTRKEGAEVWIGLNWDHWHFPEDDETVGITLAELSMEPEEGLETFDQPTWGNL